MSKTIYIKFLLLLALALSVACKKEGDIPSPAPEAQTVHYTATVQTGIDTRATVSEDMKYEFEEGDRVYMESEDGNLYGFLTLSVDGGVGKKEALFEGDLKYVGETTFQRKDNPIVHLTLVSKEDALHTITAEGKLAPVESGSYSYDDWAPSLEGAVSCLSHFTGSGHFNDLRFTLHQQSGFLKCFVRMYKAEAPVDSEFTVKLFNNNDDQLPFRQASVTVSEAGSVPFVFAYLGGQVSLDKAKLVVEKNNTQIADFDVSDVDLAANKYYSISRSTLSFKGFQIKAVYDNTTVRFNYNWLDGKIRYSLDYGETWNNYTGEFTLNARQVACIKGDRVNYKNEKKNDQWWNPDDKPIFWASNLCYISGNIMSLLGDREQLSESAFQGAFSRGGTAVTYIDIDPDAPLILPATTLAPRCYMRMFHNCTSLTRAPKFTVEVPAEKCCYNMFRKCSKLNDASSIELPAMTLEIDCYRELFRECSKLTTAPILPAPTLVKDCYRQMFSSSGIKTVICLATSISAETCLDEWMSGVPSTGTFYTDPSMTDKFPVGASGIPSGWTITAYNPNP